MYSVAHAGTRWVVMRNGEPVEHHAWYKRKRDAIKAIEGIIHANVYDKLCLEQDSTGVYVWTLEEEKQIAEYALLLIENKPRWTFNGQLPIQEIGRKQHKEDMTIIHGPREKWIDPDRYFREKRRVIAGRAEAFRPAGLELTQGIGQLT